MSRLSPRSGISKITRSQITCTVSRPTRVCVCGSLPGGQEETTACAPPNADRQQIEMRIAVSRTTLRMITFPVWQFASKAVEFQILSNNVRSDGLKPEFV